MIEGQIYCILDIVGEGGFLCVASWRRVCVCVERGFWCLCLWYMTEGEAASTARVE